MISDDDKTKGTNSRDPITEALRDRKTVDSTEDVDFGLLFEALDGIFNEEDEQEISNDRPTQNTTNKQESIIGLVASLYQGTSWNNLNQINEDRPEGCMKCVSIQCVHVNNKGTRLNVEKVLDKALENCTHAISNDWLFDDICSKCIMLSCEKVTFNEQPELSILWDETDLIQYYNWISKIDNDSSLRN